MYYTHCSTVITHAGYGLCSTNHLETGWEQSKETSAGAHQDIQPLHSTAAHMIHVGNGTLPRWEEGRERGQEAKRGEDEGKDKEREVGRDRLKGGAEECGTFSVYMLIYMHVYYVVSVIYKREVREVKLHGHRGSTKPQS